MKTNATIEPTTTITTMILVSFCVQKVLTAIRKIIMGDTGLRLLYMNVFKII